MHPSASGRVRLRGTGDPIRRRQVETLAGYGVPETEIANLIGIDAGTLRRHYREELDHGHTEATVKVAENLFRNATGDGPQSVTAAIFWLETRARWKETSVHGHVGKEPVVIEIKYHADDEKLL